MQRLGMIPNAASDIRTNFSGMFFVANGFKNNGEIAVGRGVPKEPWLAWGAQWKPKLVDARLAAESTANDSIGLALNNLRTELLKLKPPRPVADRYAAWIEERS